jgi:disease resistance protein RPM1
MMEEETVQLSLIVIRSGAGIDSIQAFYSGKDFSNRGSPPHGGNGGHEDIVAFSSGEKLQRVAGWIGRLEDREVIIGLVLFTDVRTDGVSFGTTNLEPFDLTPPKGTNIVGFFGNSGKFLDALGVLVQTP